jgi:hypothetical protein
LSFLDANVNCGILSPYDYYTQAFQHLQGPSRRYWHKLEQGRGQRNSSKIQSLPTGLARYLSVKPAWLSTHASSRYCKTTNLCDTMCSEVKVNVARATFTALYTAHAVIL